MQSFYLITFDKNGTVSIGQADSRKEASTDLQQIRDDEEKSNQLIAGFVVGNLYHSCGQFTVTRPEDGTQVKFLNYYEMLNALGEGKRVTRASWRQGTFVIALKTEPFVVGGKPIPVPDTYLLYDYSQEKFYTWTTIDSSNNIAATDWYVLED